MKKYFFVCPLRGSVLLCCVNLIRRESVLIYTTSRWSLWKMRCAMCRAVVVYCHTNKLVMARFLLRAQYRNMTNGDFAFFTYQPVRHAGIFRPWIVAGNDPEDLPGLRRAYHVVKQVWAITSSQVSQATVHTHSFVIININIVLQRVHKCQSKYKYWFGLKCLFTPPKFWILGVRTPKRDCHHRDPKRHLLGRNRT